ncbi:hypothetical protein SESBI_25863 [Sesbania bispinosa]|nr:hypothetical protein SESBI_25863 [Sesbania bispinosa]
MVVLFNKNVDVMLTVQFNNGDCMEFVEGVGSGCPVAGVGEREPKEEDEFFFFWERHKQYWFVTGRAEELGLVDVMNILP